ncbi:MAG: PIG-L family deacetylase [Candidatus Parcubacteria bacterium]|nr:PIG-L family deacetylase [Candidatus Parcubacteria bacterium]
MKFFKVNISIKSRKTQSILFLIAIISVFASIIYIKETQVLPQDAVSLFDEVKIPQAGENLLVFSPHPDDETLAAGGYILEAIKKGVKVYIVLVTDGNKRGLKERRKEEFQKATAILGVDPNNLLYLGYPDSKLNQQNLSEVKNNFSQLIDKINPNIVIYPMPEDHHSDHKITGLIASSLLGSKKDIINYQYLVHHDYYPQPMGYYPNKYLTPPLSLLKFNYKWNQFNLNFDLEQKKNAALKMYQTQLKNKVKNRLMPAFVRKNELFLTPIF